MDSIARVLVPTDFSVDSLRIVLDYIAENEGQKTEFILACGYEMGDSITSLLGFTKEDHLLKLETEDFIKGCEMIKSRFTHQVVEMYSDLIVSKNTRYLRNYFKGSAITHLALPDRFTFRKRSRGMCNMVDVLKEQAEACNVTVIPVAVSTKDVAAIDSMDCIFFRQDWRMSYE